MVTQATIQIQERTITGKAVRQLRALGIVPANIFGGDLPSEAIQVRAHDLEHAFKIHGAASIFQLVGLTEGGARAALIRHVQRTPATGVIQHIDFMRVEMTASLRARIPLRLVGDAPAVRIYGGMLVHPLDAIEVEALPGDLPQTILVDVSGLTEVGSSVLARDLALPKGVTMLAEADEVVATIVALRSGAPAAGESDAQVAAAPTQSPSA